MVQIPELTTDRLLLRAFEPRDVDPYAAMMADAEVTRHLGDGRPLVREDAWRQLAMFAGHWTLRGFGVWADEERATGRFIGRIGCFEPDGWPGFELAYRLARPSWGLGRTDRRDGILRRTHAGLPVPRAGEQEMDDMNRSCRAAIGTGAIAIALVMFVAPIAYGQSAHILGPDTVSFTSDSLTLRGIIYRPEGKGPFPTILFNHGSGTSYTKEVEAVGPAYAGHGFVFFAPSRRGQWLSTATGQYIVDSLDAIGKLQGAEARDRLLVELMNGPQLADVRAALAFITTKSYVQRDRVVVAGNSFGGIVTVFASAKLDGLWAALDFAGAAQTWAGAPRLQAAMTDAVMHARIPIFFGQAENDYDVTPSRALSAAMTRAGKPNLMRIFPPFGNTTPEGHSFGYFGGATWGPEVVAFVRNPSGR